MFGVMVDCSRNAVMNKKSLKEFILLLSEMGYDTLMLYTEDTYEIPSEPCFGHQRGRYSQADLKELDAFCRDRGIELVPCIQTLAHLNTMFSWHGVYGGVRDCDDILLAGEEKTYELIRKMFASLAASFTSRKIHIGMDEAYKVGLGRYLSLNGYERRFDIINRHLHRVCEIAAEFGFEPMIWSDMFCKLALGNDDYYKVSDPEEIKKVADLPENVSLVYWDYYSDDQSRYEQLIRVNQAFGRRVVFAGGAWTWRGFLPDNRIALRVTEPALKACAATGVEDVIITLWGDDGGECSRFSVLPSLLAAAQAAGRAPEGGLSGALSEAVGAALLLSEEMNHPTGGRDLGGQNPPKYLLYNDPFTGRLNHAVPEGTNAFYAELLPRLKEAVVSALEACPDCETLSGYFAAAEALCDVLSVKSELSGRTKKAYLSGDREALKKIAEEEYPAAQEKLGAFHDAFMRWWMSENRPQGFDVQDIRMGGLMMRLQTCRERLLAWCGGMLENIPELEEEELNVDCGTNWMQTAITGVISHNVM